jgi:lipid-A-disaccharide synthase
LPIHGHGGNKMAEQGLKILEHINNLSMVGFSEVIKHLPYMKRVMSQTIKTIKEISPLRIILIDYPGFNLRVIKRISSLDIPITYCYSSSGLGLERKSDKNPS